MPKKNSNIREIDVNVAGVNYTVKMMPPDEFAKCNVRNSLGFTDYSTRTICVCDFTKEEHKPDEMDCQQFLVNNVIKHELMHAFFFETGHGNYASDEVLVDCLAVSLEKYIILCNQADAINTELINDDNIVTAA